MAKLPKYKITIDDEYADPGQELGIDQIAFTSTPAIVVKGFAFKNQTAVKKQFFAEETKQRIIAPALIPMQIYRADDEEYFVEFTVEEIEKIRGKFMANLNKKANVFNLEHDTTKAVPADIIETWIVDNPKEDKAYSSFGIEVPKGTLMVMSQINDKTQYLSLVENEQTGYSIEGFLGLKLSALINKNKQTQMKKKLFSKTERPKFKLAKIADISVWNLDVDQDTFDVGTILTTTWTDSAGTSYTNPISDGQYYTEDGSSIFVDVAGKIVLVQGAIETPAAEAVPVEAEVAVEEKTEEVKMAEKVKEEVPVEEVKAAEPVAEVPADEKAEETKILAAVQPKLDEIYKMIADLKAEMSKAPEEVKEEPTKLTNHQKYAEAFAFLRK